MRELRLYQRLSRAFLPRYVHSRAHCIVVFAVLCIEVLNICKLIKIRSMLAPKNSEQLLKFGVYVESTTHKKNTFLLIVFEIMGLECGFCSSGFAGMYLAITLVMHLVKSANNNAALFNFK